MNVVNRKSVKKDMEYMNRREDNISIVYNISDKQNFK